MADVEFRVVSARREGLLLELGQLVIGSGFALMRQRLTSTDEGVVLTMIVRGPEQNLLSLEDRLGSHPLVHSFEASTPDPARTTQTASATPPPMQAVRPSPAVERVIENAVPAPDPQRVEVFLTMLAHDYPNVFSRALAFEHDLPAPHRESTARYAGSRLGAWIFKRDYALGARLGLADSIKHIALPAMRNLLQAELNGEGLRVKNSPFCKTGLYHGHSCHFLRGCLEGLLNEPGHLGRPRVSETHCRNTGADVCTFTFAT